MDYTKFEEGGGGSLEEKPENIDASSDGNSSKKHDSMINDVQIQMDQTDGTGGTSGLTIYNDDKKHGLEYIDDPSKAPPRTLIQSLQASVQWFEEHIIFRLVTLILILLDFSLVVVSLARDPCVKQEGLEIVSHIIICYFMLEVAFRIFYMGKRFFQNWMEVLDLVVVGGCFIIDIVFIILDEKNTCNENDTGFSFYARMLVIGRVVRGVRVVRILIYMYGQKRQVSKATRHVVSQNKRRYQRDGFDLDLCYITERVIAMSFPSTGLMAVYRNPIREVARFFDTKHPEHYRIYNLCSERDYNEELFHNRVERIFIDDHNVPTVKDMVWFCKNAREFMAEDRSNVIAVHCKGGKGRTGTIICVWLVDCGIFEDAKESLDYFGDRRTDLSVGSKFQGVETPSQSRFVGYYEKVLKLFDGQQPPQKDLTIKSFRIEGIAGVGNGDGSDFTIQLRREGLLVYEYVIASRHNCEVTQDTETDSITIELKDQPRLADDIKVRFISTNKNFPKIYDHCAFYFWFHTSFIENNKLRLARDDIDNPHKSAGRKIFRETFAIEVTFGEISE